MDIDYLLECAWRDTGAYKFLFDPNDNLTGDLLSIETMRGRDFDSAVGRWVPGQLNAILRNDDGKYSSNNALSPLSGYLKRGRPIVLSAGLRESSLAAKFVAADTRYLMCGDDIALSVGDIYWDMVAWVKVPDPTADGAILSKRVSVNDPEYYLQITGNRFVFGVRNAADTATITVTANTFGDISANTWYCVHCYHDPTANVIGISVNTGAHDTAAIAGGILDGVGDFYVGLVYLSGILRLTGDIGPLAIWKPTGTNLTAAQLTWLYNGGYGRDFTEVGVSETDGQYLIYDIAGNILLWQWWQMDEVSGTREYECAWWLGNPLTEAGGTVGSEAGLETKVYRGLWAGSIDAIMPSVPVPGTLHTCTIKGLGPLSLLGAAEKLDLPVTSDLTSVWIGRILFAFSSGAADLLSMLLDFDEGKTITGLFYPANDATSLELIRQMEDSEPGLLYEFLSARSDSMRDFLAKPFIFGFTNRWHRLESTRSLIPQATFSDAPGGGLSIMGLEQLEPLNSIYNNVQVTVMAPAHADPLAVLWSFSPPTSWPILVPGQSITFTAKYPTDTTGGANASHVDPWTTPTIGAPGSGADIIVSPNAAHIILDGLPIKSANEMTFTIKNTSTTQFVSSQRTLLQIQARGIPWIKAAETLVSAEDTTSIAAYGLRAYPLPPKWLPDIAVAQNFCDYIVSRYCLPHNRLRMTFVANRDVASMHQALTGLIGDRVTIDADGASGLGIHEDFYIENICHQMSQGKIPHTVIYELVSCSGEGAYWVLGTSELEYAAAHPTYPTSRLEY